MDLKQEISTFIEQYPQAELQDIFKLIYQIVMGPNHLNSDIKAIRENIKNEVEISKNKHVQNKEIFETISSSLVRVNLIPYYINGNDLDSLAKAFFESGKCYKRSNIKLIDVIDFNYGNLNALTFFDNKEYQRLVNELKANDFKPISHTLSFKNNYDPHYRIISTDEFLKIYKS